MWAKTHAAPNRTGGSESLRAASSAANCGFHVDPFASEGINRVERLLPNRYPLVRQTSRYCEDVRSRKVFYQAKTFDCTLPDAFVRVVERTNDSGFRRYCLAPSRRLAVRRDEANYTDGRPADLGILIAE